MSGLLQVGYRGAHTDSVDVVQRTLSHSRRVWMVLVERLRIACRDAGVPEGPGGRQQLLPLVSADGDRAARAVKVVPAEVQIRLGLTEVLQGLDERPLVVALLCPLVVVLRNPPEEHLPVDRAGASGHLAAGKLERRPSGCRGGHVPPRRRVVPVGGEPGVVTLLHLYRQLVRVRVVRPGFQKQHRSRGVFRQPCREHRARGACPYDHHVVSHTPPLFTQDQGPPIVQRRRRSRATIGCVGGRRCDCVRPA